ncbi:ATP-binding protein [Aeromonas caviae]|uniref:ATP-binding protein n=1 Tax=Aeromonas caviae TaxID=648 RepID=UPI00244A7E63|nr:ATP-binding protein [Aeromonas caviae]MDH1994059.1 ATP-binding protein [Aeromonas caviae]
MSEDKISKQDNPTSPFEVKIPAMTLDSDVILAPETRRLFEEAIGAMKHHKTIYSEWGFGEVDPMGRNMILNLYGPPGTGKTLAAEAFAGSLGRQFIHIGIAELESKYVGDTAKNISAAFMAAAMEGAVLFFDEADTLLGARLSSVTQGIDNEINAMRSTLLIELERFDGVVLFATNFAKNYDNAFVSRIRYHIEFKLPDFDCRSQLWQHMLVPGIPLHEQREQLIDLCAQESEGFSGREIRTVLRTAFPRALMESPQECRVKWSHIKSAIDEVRVAKKNVGRRVTEQSTNAHSVEPARQLLGISDQ